MEGEFPEQAGEMESDGGEKMEERAGEDRGRELEKSLEPRLSINFGEAFLTTENCKVESAFFPALTIK